MAVDVALTRNGDPVLSWVELGDIGHVSIWNGAGWTAAPTLPQTASRAGGTHPQFLALDAFDAPMLIANAVVNRLVGGAWQPVTAPIPVNPSGSNFRMTSRCRGWRECVGHPPASFDLMDAHGGLAVAEPTCVSTHDERVGSPPISGLRVVRSGRRSGGGAPGRAV